VVVCRHEQRHGHLRRRRAGVLQVRLQQRIARDIGTVQQSVGCLAIAPALRLHENPFARRLHHAQSQATRPARTPGITELRRGKLLSNPQLVCVHGTTSYILWSTTF
jgi:hypothetical protein